MIIKAIPTNKYIKKGNYVEINRKLKESGEKYPPVWLTINILR